MSVSKNLRRQKIRFGIRKKISGTNVRPRASVFKSNRGIYVQLIDDVKGVTLVSASSREINEKSLNVSIAYKVGSKLAENAKKIGVEDIVFDRGGYYYHGKIKSLAEGARKGGLKF